MTKAITTAIDLKLISPDTLSEVYSQGESRIMWHDDYFIHLMEVLDSGEVIYQSRPVRPDEGWMFEDI